VIVEVKRNKFEDQDQFATAFLRDSRPESIQEKSDIPVQETFIKIKDS
jgi:hypothetical protein